MCRRVIATMNHLSSLSKVRRAWVIPGGRAFTSIDRSLRLRATAINSHIATFSYCGELEEFVLNVRCLRVWCLGLRVKMLHTVSSPFMGSSRFRVRVSISLVLLLLTGVVAHRFVVVYCSLFFFFNQKSRIAMLSVVMLLVVAFLALFMCCW